MLMIEFTERTGITTTDEEYAVIEDMYYDFDGDKDLFGITSSSGYAEWNTRPIMEP